MMNSLDPSNPASQPVHSPKKSFLTPQMAKNTTINNLKPLGYKKDSGKVWFFQKFYKKLNEKNGGDANQDRTPIGTKIKIIQENSKIDVNKGRNKKNHLKNALLGSHDFNGIYFSSRWSHEFHKAPSARDSCPQVNLTRPIGSSGYNKHELTHKEKSSVKKIEKRIQHLLGEECASTGHHLLTDGKSAEKAKTKLKEFANDYISQEAAKSAARRNPPSISKPTYLPELKQIRKWPKKYSKKALILKIKNTLEDDNLNLDASISRSETKQRGRSSMLSFLPTRASLKDQKNLALLRTRGPKKIQNNKESTQVIDDKETCLGRLQRIQRDIDLRLDTNLSFISNSQPNLISPQRDFTPMASCTSTLDFISQDLKTLKHNREKTKLIMSKQKLHSKSYKAKVKPHKHRNSLSSVFKSFHNTKNAKLPATKIIRFRKRTRKQIHPKDELNE
ncbi:unnamed protein product [Moneuplotes crassus]|uniref:Uncharacterized protein n=1 Tax=Euplotes crassus TaxID=5936 RepID=A0AAD2D6F8_EUPCR|nr:unnamed protein product [Moneuplotes crassus]